MSITSGTKVGRYEIETMIGSGGMGIVYRARDLQLRREVAIKVLPENLAQDNVALRRLEREARAIAALSHPNILDIHDFGTHEGTAYVVMELLQGKNLKRCIHERAFSFEEVLEIGLAIAEGLHAAHSKGVIHRDLKPDNIFITSDSRVKILDFGLAVLKPVFSGEELSNASTATGIGEEGINGTVPYISPEQLRGRPTDARSDLFSFGCVFYEMIARRPPFLRETVVDSIAAILHEEPAYDHEIEGKAPPRAIRILRSCLEKDPSKRIPDAHTLVKALSRGSDQLDAQIKTLKTSVPVSRRWISVSLIVALLMVGSIAVSYLRRFRSPGAPPKMLSLAVLPLKNISGDPQDEYFADGITEEITSRIARISTLRVISGTSAMQYKKSTKSLKQIAGELKVDALLEGSVRRKDGKIRLLTNLISAESDKNIWSRTYEQEVQDVLELQNDLARGVAQELRATLTSYEREQLSTQKSILPEAYNAYLSGLSHERTEGYTRESLLRVIALYNQAVELEPEFALAYASLSRAHSMIQHFMQDLSVNHASLAKQAVDRALEIDPDLPEAHLAMGYYYYWCMKDYDRALNHFGIARKLLPNDTKALEGIAYIQRRIGNCEVALLSLKKAYTLSPRDLRISNELANTYSMLRQYPKADEYYDIAISLAPDQISPYLFKIDNYYLWDGSVTRAHLLFQKLPPTEDNIDLYWIGYDFYARDYRSAVARIEASPVQLFDNQNDFVPKDQMLGAAYRLLKQPDRARLYYEKAKGISESYLKMKPRDPRILGSVGLINAGLGYCDTAIENGKLSVEVVPLNKNIVEGVFRGIGLAKIYTMCGKYDSAVDYLERLLAKPSYISIPLLQLDPEFEPLQKLPRFRNLAERQKKN